MKKKDKRISRINSVDLSKKKIVLGDENLARAIEAETKLVKKLVKEYGNGPYPFYTIINDLVLCRISRDNSSERGIKAEQRDQVDYESKKEIINLLDEKAQNNRVHLKTIRAIRGVKSLIVTFRPDYPGANTL